MEARGEAPPGPYRAQRLGLLQRAGTSSTIFPVSLSKCARPEQYTDPQPMHITAPTVGRYQALSSPQCPHFCASSGYPLLRNSRITIAVAWRRLSVESPPTL